MKYFLLFIGFFITNRLNAQTLEGKIIAVDTAQSTAQFQTNKELKTIQLLPGDVAINWSQKKVKCTLVKNGDATRTDLIFPADSEELRQVAEVTDALRRDTVERGDDLVSVPETASAQTVQAQRDLSEQVVCGSLQNSFG